MRRNRHTTDTGMRHKRRSGEVIWSFKQTHTHAHTQSLWMHVPLAQLYRNTAEPGTEGYAGAKKNWHKYERALIEAWQKRRGGVLCWVQTVKQPAEMPNACEQSDRSKVSLPLSWGWFSFTNTVGKIKHACKEFTWILFYLRSSKTLFHTKGLDSVRSAG